MNRPTMYMFLYRKPSERTQVIQGIFNHQRPFIEEHLNLAELQHKFTEHEVLEILTSQEEKDIRTPRSNEDLVHLLSDHRRVFQEFFDDYYVLESAVWGFMDYDIIFNQDIFPEWIKSARDTLNQTEYVDRMITPGSANAPLEFFGLAGMGFEGIAGSKFVTYKDFKLIEARSNYVSPGHAGQHEDASIIPLLIKDGIFISEVHKDLPFFHYSQFATMWMLNTVRYGEMNEVPNITKGSWWIGPDGIFPFIEDEEFEMDSRMKREGKIRTMKMYRKVLEKTTKEGKKEECEECANKVRRGKK